MSSISNSAITEIEAATGWRKDRVQIFDLPEGKFIVKGHRPVRSMWRYRVLNAMAQLLRAPYLRAVPMHGGARSQAIELARLAALKKAGISVPDVLHIAPDYFLMSYLGQECLGSLINAGHPNALALWRETCAQLRAAHAAGQYMSQCFGRNIIVAEQLQGFIDFEDDPCEVFTLQQAQVRDWLIFLYSTLGVLQIPRDQLDACLAQELAAERPDIQAELRKIAFAVKWLQRLPSNPKTLGRDVYRAQSCARILHHWATQRPLIST